MPVDANRRLDRTLERLEHFGLKLGLERMRRVLAELGSPEQGLAVVLVAGTNGKGSTSAWLASMISAAGYCSGLFTSPHLERVEERLRIDGRAVETERLEELVDKVVAASERTGGEVITFFEALTAAAFCLFREQEVDVAVMEVGLGGRLDATNICEPHLSLITQIALDHQKQLGDTLQKIAREKAGIMRSQRPCLASVASPEVERTLREVALEVGSELGFATERVAIEASEAAGQLEKESVEEGRIVALRGRRGKYRLRPRLRGAHQLENLTLAVAAAENLASSILPALDGAAIELGVESCRWPGRLEQVATADGKDVLFDGAHNPAGLRALVDYLVGLDQPFDLVFGMLKEKIEPAVVRRLWSLARRVVVTRPDSVRAMEPGELVELLDDSAGHSTDWIAIEADPGRATESALASSDLVVVCGSLYLVGEVRGWLRATHGAPPLAEGLFDRQSG